MSAPPVVTPKENINIIKLSDMQCFKHPNNKIVGVCNDKNCNAENKYMCADCMFEIHPGHVGIKLDLLEDNYINKINLTMSEQESFKSEFINFKKNLRIKIDKIKDKVNYILEQFYESILNLINKNKFIKSYYAIELIKNNYPPKNNEQLNKLIQNLLRLYITKDNSCEENNNKKLLIIKQFNNYEELVQTKINSLLYNLNTFLDFKDDNIYQWSTHTYAGYDFFYKLEEDNTKATKIKKGGKITVCRGIKPLEKGNIYKLEYFINYSKGDFDVGFGTEKNGVSCWLRYKNGYSVTSSGIYINGTHYDLQIIYLMQKK